jgi:hypothetical protein
LTICSTWYGITRGGFQFFFEDSAYLQVDDDSSQNEGYNKDTTKGDNVINIGGFLDKDDSGFFFL